MDPQKYEYVVSATVRPVEDPEVSPLFEVIKASTESPEVLEALNRSEAAASPIIEGRPRMLHLEAFICHGGRNNNGDILVEEELKQAVEERKLFQEGYAGFVDFNHDMIPRGYWYSSEWAYDPKAQKYGILAKGAIWAGLYPELADKLIAEQTRSGKVPVSIFALSNSVEFVKAEDGRQNRIFHEPVIVAASVLDVPPADPNGRTTISEDPLAQTEEERRQQLLKAEQATGGSTGDEPTQEVKMDLEQLKELLQSALSGLGEDVVAQLTAQLEEKVNEVRAQFDGQKAEIETLTAKVAETEARVKELEAEIAEKDLAIQGLNEAKAGLEAKVSEIETENTSLKAAETERAFEAKKTARYGALPEEVKARFDAKDEATRANLLNKWANESDDQFNVTLAELSLGAVVAGTRLPGTGDKTTDVNERIKNLLRS